MRKSHAKIACERHPLVEKSFSFLGDPWGVNLQLLQLCPHCLPQIWCHTHHRSSGPPCPFPGRVAQGWPSGSFVVPWRRSCSSWRALGAPPPGPTTSWTAIFERSIRRSRMSISIAGGKRECIRYKDARSFSLTNQRGTYEGRSGFYSWFGRIQL